MTSPHQDRRIKTRYEAQCLEVQMRERGFLGRKRLPTAVTCLDMNRYGMAVLSPRAIEPGTRLFLDFSGKYISESSVAARVVEAYPYQAGFRIGIQFSYLHEKRGYSRAVDNALARIEGFYNRLAG